MKSLNQDASGELKPKRSTQNFPAKYWATLTSTGEKRKVERSDGSVSTDKTAGFHSRPKKKEEIRNANRSLKKSARQQLKRAMTEASEESEEN